MSKRIIIRNIEELIDFDNKDENRTKLVMDHRCSRGHQKFNQTAI